MKMEKVKLGIIGLGRLGRKHAENIHYHIPQAELTAICSIVQEELDSVSKEMTPKYVTTNYREILDNHDLDGIVIASSSQEHAVMICEAANAGRQNVYTEKPIGMTLQEIDDIKAAVEANTGMKFQVGYNRRFDQSVQAAKQKLDEGFIGTPIQIKMINRDPASMAEFIIKFSPKSGGLIMDMLTHDYDCARWFVGAEAKSVYGLGDAYVYEGLKAVDDIDNCVVLVEFKNGVMGQIETSRNCTYGYHVETEIYGSEGCIRIGTTPYKDRVTYMNANGVTVKCADWFFEYWEPTFLAEMQDFVDCILEDRQPLVGLEDGYRAVEWAYAATDAVKHRKIVYMD
ncbi:inositol 2-dehydrogenase [candidate division KSB3 bacterium]|uniref:Inositol 2-dehydrogenase n=1 Tax=candidate division KSB3 bacterium TaxID=2044937 RepID=A0A9D5Q746_9BACT|nr:inositol 2-dehydrogenase [candidate division KSB3 bacterium]MBD3326475.1 inositol 2-dehydrogenase [candidate division KSB3 bacterium]